MAVIIETHPTIKIRQVLLWTADYQLNMPHLFTVAADAQTGPICVFYFRTTGGTTTLDTYEVERVRCMRQQNMRRCRHATGSNITSR